MRDDRAHWNRKHLDQSCTADPAASVVRFAGLARPGLALDVAAGTGINSRHLAELGFIVEAVDIADVALATCMPKHPRIRPVCMDLNRFDPPSDRYDLIVNIRYLNRRLFPYLAEALTPGGILIVDTFLAAPGGNASEPHCRDHLLRPNELLRAFLHLNIVHYSEGEGVCDKGTGLSAILVARK